MNYISIPRTLLIFASVLILVGCKQSQENEKIGSSSDKPNILLIVADDLGYSDISPYGGNIHTPVLEQLSKEGISFKRFYVQPTCSPTRSSLLTGNDNHVAGLGIMSEANYPQLQALNLPGYSGELSKQVVTIPEVLSDFGYHTYMAGKWHLGEGPGKDPYDRGFEETFILGSGGGSHFYDRKPLSPLQHMDYTRNGKLIDLPKDFYSTTAYTDTLIKFIEKNREDQKPFFAYLSYTAVHDPLHAPKEYIEKYKGKFDTGWDALWLERLNNLKKLGIVPKDLNKFSKNPRIPEWKSLSPDLKKEFARDMEVYAAMLDYMDMSIGRVFDYLKQHNMYDNTVVIFISDNGANGASARTYPGNEDEVYLRSFNNVLDNRGLQNSYIEMGSAWAQASASPFRYFKGFTSEGGIRVPLIIKMPGQMKNAGQWNNSFIHVTDFMPTILEIAGANYPKHFKGNEIKPYIGKSFLPILNGDTSFVKQSEGYGWELFELKAYIKDYWKILRLPKPMGSGEWELYDLENDPAETTDLSNKYPEIKKQLIDAWKEYARKNELHDHQAHYDSFYQKSFVPKKD